MQFFNLGFHLPPSKILSFTLIFLIQIFCNTFPVNASNFDFRIYDNKDGLNSPDVICVFADVRSYIWIGGADGLTKYDGEKFYNYNKIQGLNDTQINCITQSKNGEIYCGTRKGVSIFDGFRFRNIKMKDEISSPFSPHYVKCIYISKKSEIFAGCIDGLFKLDKKRNVFVRVWKIRAFTNNIISNNKGTIFFSTSGGTYSLKNDVYSKISICKSTKHLKINALAHIFEDYYWAATTSGFAKLKLVGSQFTIVKIQGAEFVTSVLSCKNKITLFTGKTGLLFLSKNNLFQTIDLSQRITHTQIKSASQDYQGNIWLATTVGLIKMVETDVFKSPMSAKISSPVASMTIDKSGTIFLGTLDGLNVITNLKVKKLYVSSDPKDNFISALTYQNDELYVGTFSGKVFKLKNNRFQFLLQTRNSNACIYRILPLTNDELWVTSGEEIIHFKDNKPDYHKISTQYTQDLLIDKSGCIWFANMAKLMLFKNQKLQSASKVFDKYENFVTLSEDLNGTMWIGTFGNGLLRYSKGQVTQITAMDGLSNDYISSSFFEKEHNILWIGTMYGVSKIRLGKNSKVLSIDNYLNEANRESYGCVQNAITKLKNGNLLFSVGEELFEFNSENVANRKRTIKIQLNSLKVNQRKVFKLKSTIFKFDDWTRIPVLPKFKSNENNVEFTFNAIDFHSPQKIKYAWKLIGNDSEWIPFNDRNYVSYTNLPHGQYCLKVKAVNQSGEKSTILSYPFLISKPYYLEWWFIALSAFIPLILVFWFIKWRINKVLIKEAEKNKNYIKLAESELKALRAQMNPHFMFNTLNSIQEIVLGNDDKTARIYFSDFSKMMRMILENSTQRLITLEKEIDFLKLYLSFEKLRFNSKMEFILEVDEQLEPSFIKIPAMLLQPFIENAINHGLLHKEEEGKLVVKFEQIDYQNELFLRCTIEDNGIGRVASKQFNNWKEKEHNSISTIVSLERIELLNTIMEDKKFYLFITDLMNGNDSNGTRVEVLISI